MLQVVCLLAKNEKGEFLLVRKKKHWIFPGGKMEAEETREDALARELKEETTCDIEIYQYLESASGINPFSGRMVECHMFFGGVLGEPVASSEINEVGWFKLPFPGCSEVTRKVMKKYANIVRP